MNKASNIGIDLRIGPSKDNNGGYVAYYPAKEGCDIREYITPRYVNNTSARMNNWLESLFC